MRNLTSGFCVLFTTALVSACSATNGNVDSFPSIDAGAEGEGEGGDFCATHPEAPACQGGEGEGEGEGGAEGEGEGEGEECASPPCGCNGDPPWFDGTWLVEYPQIEAVNHEFDFTTGRDRVFWTTEQIKLIQKGCEVQCDGNTTNLICGGSISETTVEPPNGFVRNHGWISDLEQTYWLIFTGQLSADHQSIEGTCAGLYPDRSTAPTTYFQIRCGFKLTRQ